MQKNILRNSKFVECGENGIAAHWQISGPLQNATRLPTGNGSYVQRLYGSGTAPLVFSQVVAVKPHCDYIFRCRLRSNDRAWVEIGPRQMGYNLPGQWQTIADVVRAHDDSELLVQVCLGGWLNAENWLEVEDVQMFLAERPVLPARRKMMPIILDRQTTSFIVHPLTDGYPQLADQFKQQMIKRFGGKFALLSDKDATNPDQPVIRNEFRDSQLFLLGRLGHNRAFWPFYNRFLCAADGAYPGDDGFALRTAVNAFDDGRSHLLFAGGDADGTAAAVARFLNLLDKGICDKSADSALPWLLETELRGDCLERFKADDALWQQDSAAAALPPLEPGYGTVTRWYWNAMAYYWSSWNSYRERADQILSRVLADSCYTHHYIAEWLVRVYRMLDCSPIFTEQQQDGMDALIFKNFWEFLTGPDLIRMRIFAPPFEKLELSNRHDIAPWMADLAMAEFLESRFELSGVLAGIVAYRKQEKQAAMDYLVSHRWNSSFPSIYGPDNDEEVTASLFRYALEHERYDEFFESGLARKGLMLEKIDHVAGRWVRPAGHYDYGLILGMLSCYYQDGQSAALLHTLPPGVPPDRNFMNRYICGCHRYTPGSEIASAELDSLPGVARQDPQTDDIPRLCNPAENFCDFQADPDSLFEIAAFRGGFERQHDYVALTGTAGPAPAGAILDFSSSGVYWFGSGRSAIFEPSSVSYWDHNAVHVLRTDKFPDTDVLYPAAAECRWCADFADSGGVSYALSPFADTCWRREILWLRNGLYIMRDSITALEDGSFDIAVNWRPHGRLESFSGDAALFRQGRSFLQLSLLNENTNFRSRLRAETGTERTFLRHIFSGSLQKGQTVVSTVLLQTVNDPQELLEILSPSAELLLLRTPQTSDVTTAVYSGPFTTENLETDAAVTVVKEAAISFIDASFCRVGQVVLRQETSRANISVSSPLRQIRQSSSDGRQRCTDIADIEVNKSDIFSAVAEQSGRILRQHTAAAGASLHQVTADQADAAAVAQPCVIEADPGCDWSNSCFQKPAEITDAELVAEDLLDLGSSVQISEIRAGNMPGKWQPRRLPDEIWYADVQKGKPLPAADSPLWQLLTDKRQWHRGVETGNYGRAVPREQVFQSIFPKQVKARFIRAAGARNLMLFSDERLQARVPLILQAADLDGDGEAEVVVSPEAWPAFIRNRYQDDRLAVIKTDGTVLGSFKTDDNLQAVRILAPNGVAPQIFALTDSAQLHVLDCRCREMRKVDLYQMHQDFDREKGRPNTRHPAGGLTMPYDIGIWRPNAQGRSKAIVSRYCGYTFLDEDLNFEGVLHDLGYVQAPLLPHGLKLQKDAEEEQLCLGRDSIHRIFGSEIPHVDDPDGHFFYPQVYRKQLIPAPAESHAGVDGDKIFIFTPVKLDSSEVPRFVLVARANFLAIYDIAERHWRFCWKPSIKFSAAAVIVNSHEQVTVLAATEDERLWELHWQNPDALSSWTTAKFNSRINRVRQVPKGCSGHALICADAGLFLYKQDGKAVRLSSALCQDAVVVPTKSTSFHCTAVTEDGKIIGLTVPDEL